VSPVLVLGCGYAGSAVARRARSEGRSVLVTVRSPARAESLRAQGFEVLCSAQLDASIAQHVTPETQVVVAYQPDPETDAQVAPALCDARAISYVSSTGVYDPLHGVIDDSTQVPQPPTPRAARLLRAEEAYRAVGATVLRCPGIYGPDRGLHMRILRGEHRIPGDGSLLSSRIHVEDLASFALAADRAPDETFVLGDLSPAPMIELVRYVCEAYGVPMPPSVPIDQVHETLRANRAVDGRRARERLGVTLQFPTYREGMRPHASPAMTPPAKSI
jgi:nucleoside-diphosphate-sugar epimerase